MRLRPLRLAPVGRSAAPLTAYGIEGMYCSCRLIGVVGQFLCILGWAEILVGQIEWNDASAVRIATQITTGAGRDLWHQGRTRGVAGSDDEGKRQALLSPPAGLCGRELAAASISR